LKGFLLFTTRRQLVSESFMLASERIISGYTSKVFSLNQINSAFDFIKNKECAGKVLIDLQVKDADPEDLDSDKKTNDKKSTTKEDDD
jgi:hypothetical protein